MNTTEIYLKIEEVFADYSKSLEKYSPSQFDFKADEETWSLVQMYEHVCVTSKKFFLAKTKRCLERRNGQEGGEKNSAGENVFKYGGFPPKMKFKMPAAVAEIPIFGQSVDHYKKEIDEILSSAKLFIEAVESDLGTYKTQHPALGMLNAKEWFHSLEMHSRHHLNQKVELEALSAHV
ncbi:DinB family protein [Lacihabitans soyangensis]|uniref:DinB family protein n=3 Tax=Lacihabitans soyangensis TaxID=869394 RepID=A0AAE3KTH8_9BACT|nr:DinB family protein [Lacihabitans soyangensis]MCP9763764.1 DinB family protein [Lacihabitans soyangensis]